MMTDFRVKFSVVETFDANIFLVAGLPGPRPDIVLVADFGCGAAVRLAGRADHVRGLLGIVVMSCKPRRGLFSPLGLARSGDNPGSTLGAWRQ
tara:strand:+ start:997 stop:1275 length:279 start_codon:yes stop_codon:yes gene_type:complete